MNPLNHGVEVIKNRLFYLPVNVNPVLPNGGLATHAYARKEGKEARESDPILHKIHYFNIDNELVYWNFFLDFGPLNLGQLYKFCEKLNSKLKDERLVDRIICFYSSTSHGKRANAIFLMCAWQVLYLGRTPEESYQGFCHEAKYSELIKDNASLPPVEGKGIAPIPPFHDATSGPCSYKLTILHCLKGLVKARSHGFFTFDDFPSEEYKLIEQVENGDMSWIIGNKIMAFASPSFERVVTPEGSFTFPPSHYIPYFQKKNVGLVVRLNSKCYNEKDFQSVGIAHVEHSYTDGSCPSRDILQNVLKAFESVPHDKAFAVHCKAGLGRTGTCIGAYMMKHYHFTASEAIGWMRICRPGMVIGPQQQYLEDIQKVMWYEGGIAKTQPSKYTMRIASFKGIEGQAEKLQAAKRKTDTGYYGSSITINKDQDDTRQDESKHNRESTIEI